MLVKELLPIFLERDSSYYIRTTDVIRRISNVLIYEAQIGDSKLLEFNFFVHPHHENQLITTIQDGKEKIIDNRFTLEKFIKLLPLANRLPLGYKNKPIKKINITEETITKTFMPKTGQVIDIEGNTYILEILTE